MYRQMVSTMDPITAIVQNSIEHSTVLEKAAEYAQSMDTMKLVSCLDIISILPDDMLVKVDRATMSVGLEARVPLLNHNLIEFMAMIPSDLVSTRSRSKQLLRNVLARYIPSKMIQRPKMGFSMPIDQWLRGPLRGWAESLLEPSKLRSEGYLNPREVQRIWQEHLSGLRNWSLFIWAVIMFQEWLEAYIPRPMVGYRGEFYDSLPAGRW